MSEPESTPGTPSRIRALMAIPLVFSAIALVGALYVFRHINQQHAASGERLTLRLEGTCAAEARDVVYRRAELIGLGEPALQVEAAAVVLTATMPGLPDDRQAIPALLARRGDLQISAAAGPLATADDVASATVNLDTSGQPYAEVALNPLAAARISEALRAGASLDVALDGAVIVHQEGGDLEGDKLILSPPDGEPRARMRQAADWAILLSAGSMPCALTVASVAAAPSPG